MIRALLPDLNRAILQLAPVRRARARVPIIDVGADPHGIAFDSGGMIVWDGASDSTVYGDACVNHAFRAWHDAAHIAGAFPFTLSGEIAACEFQLTQLRDAFPRHPQSWDALIRAEVIGQAEYYSVHGEFPSDQYAFMVEYLSRAP